MKPLVFVVYTFAHFRQMAAVEYSCEIFRENIYTAELGNKCYVLKVGHFTWYEARERCETSNGQLARLGNSDQYDFVLNGHNYYHHEKKYRTDHIFAWIDGQKIGGQLYWTNGQVMTYSKPIIWGWKSSPGTFCISASKNYFDEKECKLSESYICEYAKQPTPVKTGPETSARTTHTPAATSTYSIPSTASVEEITSYAERTKSSSIVEVGQTRKRRFKRQMHFREVKCVGGVLNPKFILKPDESLPTVSVAHCGARCMTDQICGLFNFSTETGECRIYHDKHRAMKTGVKSVKGWKIYQRCNTLDDPLVTVTD